MLEVKISGAYIGSARSKNRKVAVAQQDVVATAASTNAVEIKICPGKQDQITLLGHRIYIKDIDVGFDDSTQFYKLKWYEKTNLPYTDDMRRNVWFELYESHSESPVFEKLSEKILEDFPLSTPELYRKLEFAIFAETSNNTGFFLQAEEVNEGSTSVFTINHCGTVADGSFKALKAYLENELAFSDSEFALPAGVRFSPICSAEKVYIREK